MKTPSKSLHRILALAGLAVVPYGPTFSLHAANIYWDGGTNLAWGVAANWSTSATAPTPNPTAVPGISDVAIFNISGANTDVIMGLNDFRSAQGLIFNSTGAVEIRARTTGTTGHALTLGESGIVMNAGAGAATLVSNGTTGFLTIRLASNQTWTNDSSSALTVQSGIGNSINGADRTLTLAGAGSGGIFLNGPISNFVAVTSGTTSVAVNRPGGTVTLGSATNTYTGATKIDAGTLALTANATLVSNSIQIANGATFDVSTRSAFTVATGKALGGDGTVTGNLSFASGANFIFNTTATLDVSGAVSFDNSFGVANLVNADGSTVSWAAIQPGVYNLLTNGSDFSNITNFGSGNRVDLGDGKFAFFDAISGNLALNVSAIPEPSSFALLGGLIALGFVASRRRRLV